MNDQEWKRYWHNHQKMYHRTEQKLKEWGYKENEGENPKCCGYCRFSRICEHIEGFYPEVFCERLRNLHLYDTQIFFLGVCRRFKESEY